MINVAYCNVENLDLNKAYRLVPKDRKEKIDFYRFEKDKKFMNCVGFRRGVNFFSIERNLLNYKNKKGNINLATNIKIRDYRLLVDKKLFGLGIQIL